VRLRPELAYWDYESSMLLVLFLLLFAYNPDP
jgi:hypothetical protein